MRFSVEESRRKINEKLTQSAASYKTVVVVAEEVAGVDTRTLLPTGDRITGLPKMMVLSVYHYLLRATLLRKQRQ
jgi:hypothetical protein